MTSTRRTILNLTDLEIEGMVVPTRKVYRAIPSRSISNTQCMLLTVMAVPDLFCMIIQGTKEAVRQCCNGPVDLVRNVAALPPGNLKSDLLDRHRFLCREMVVQTTGNSGAALPVEATRAAS
jgi:hypothetical protein